MDEAALHEVLASSGPPGVGELDETGRDPFVVVEREAIVDVLRFLRDDTRCRMEMLHLVTAVDRGDRMEVVYHVCSQARHHALTLKVVVPRPEDADAEWRPEVPSVAGVYPAADWHEREQWDLLGVRFTGHPDPRRILLPEEWIGHPLRKDYVYPTEHGGVPLELDAIPMYERGPDELGAPAREVPPGEPLPQGQSASSTRPHAGGKVPEKEPDEEGES